MVIVKLDNPKYPSGPGTVIGHCDTVEEYRKRTEDRDGTPNRFLRLRLGDFAIGTRVATAQYHNPNNKLEVA